MGNPKSLLSSIYVESGNWLLLLVHFKRMGEYLPNKKSVWRKTLYEIMYGKLNVISAFLLNYTSEVNYVFLHKHYI